MAETTKVNSRPTAVALAAALGSVVGTSHVRSKDRHTRYYRSGFRSGSGVADAVVFPGTLLEQWRCLQVCVDAGAAIVMQAAKTGLTEGSTPSGDEYGRPVVIINVTRLKGITLLDGGRQALVKAGATLRELEHELATVDRAPHSVIGSSGIGATVVGGIANNSGGALCKRGAAYTELSLYARVNDEGELELVDDLGIDGLGDTPEEILTRLEHGDFSTDGVNGLDIAASDRTYATRVRHLDAPVPSRYNADPLRLHGVSGSAGKVAAFAVRVDTFAVPKETRAFLLGTDDPEALAALRRSILSSFAHLPEMAEYLDRSTFECAERYGKDVFLAVKHLGTRRLPKAYAFKARAEHALNRIPFLPDYLPDRVLYRLSRLLPKHLPERMRRFGIDHEHFLILVVADDAIEETTRYLDDVWRRTPGCDVLECDDREHEAVLLHRFAAAGAALRYQTIRHRRTEEVLALDVALLGRDTDWVGEPTGDTAEGLDRMLSYGHFLCHVFHRDYIYVRGTDLNSRKAALLERLTDDGAKYPAEHNVGHLYEADDSLRTFYTELDPTNTFNPGIGKTHKSRRPCC